MERNGPHRNLERPDVRSDPPAGWSLQSRRRAFACLTACGWILIAMICLSTGACVRQETGCGEEFFAEHPEQCTYFVKVKIDKPRFEFPPAVPSPSATPVPIRPSQDFWVRAGDQIMLRWEEYSLLHNNAGSTCDFTTNPPPSTQDCDVCRYCNPGMGCRHPAAFTDGTRPELLCFDAFMMESEPVIQTLGVLDGCRTGYAFTPPKNATYQLVKYSNSTAALAETKVFVVEPGGAQRVTYPLLPLTQNNQDGVFYHATVPGESILEDNFSNNLKITRVRLLKGSIGEDPVTGKLQIINSSVVHPSRLVLISNYDGGEIAEGGRDNIGCYADESADGDLDLSRCRTMRGLVCTDEIASCTQIATPTSYSDSPDLLTWVAEFKPMDGGIIPVLEAGEILAIEFTIEAE